MSIELDIPDFGRVCLEHLVLDYNGTIARDGQLMSNIDKTLENLANCIRIHIITADTGGTVSSELEGLPFDLHIIAAGGEAVQKEEYVIALGAENVACIGNGANDRLMLKAARIGIAVLEGECSAASAIINSDIVARSIYDALGLFMVPKRIVATLRGSL